MSSSSTSYKVGVSGNPNGRPKQGYSITETFREMFGTNPALKKRLANKVLDKALSGDIVACKLIWGYMDGLPQTSQISSVQLQVDSTNRLRSIIESDRKEFGLN